MSRPGRFAPPIQRAASARAVQRMESSGQFGYNPSDLGPFLRDSQDKPVGQGLVSKNPNTNTGVYVYHATRFENLKGIILNGLDPNVGGTDRGASVLDVSEQKIQESKEGSKGVVTVATKTLVASYYAAKFDNAAEGDEWGRKKLLKDYAVVLRIKNAETFGTWRKDKQDQRGNYQTHTRIPPESIEFLTFSGWVPIQSIDLAILEDAMRVPPPENWGGNNPYDPL
ncbi:MAG TPA: hypothetical protein VKV17_15515 [Bryobacteraceae bacterium]|nr:hypothetical protein [Bryobacteraceae bacterium]